MADAALRSRTSPARPRRTAYLLQDDLSRRERLLHVELGPDARTFVQDGALLFVAPDRGAAVDAYAAQAHRALAAYLEPGRLRAGPERAVTVFVQSGDASYARLCRMHLNRPCDAPWGFTLLGSREIFVNAAHGAGTLLHEMLHPLMADDWSDWDAGLPRWLGEGMASLYEQSRFTADGDLHAEKNGRLETLLRGLAIGDPAARMSALFGLSDGAFRGEEGGDAGGPVLELHEATARYLMLWLQDTHADEGGPWRFYREWRDGLAGDPMGSRAFARVVGSTPEEAEAEWERWVEALRAP